jgi:hypothetical protein
MFENVALRQAKFFVQLFHLLLRFFSVAPGDFSSAVALLIPPIIA